MSWGHQGDEGEWLGESEAHSWLLAWGLAENSQPIWVGNTDPCDEKIVKNREIE